VEPDSLDRVPTSNVALASLSWTVSDFVESGDETTFELVCGAAGDCINSRLETLKFVVHLPSDNNNSTEIKFDVDIDGYTWVQGDARLSLAYQMKRKVGGSTEESEGSGRDGDT
jgi:hypothetical protein